MKPSVRSSHRARTTTIRCQSPSIALLAAVFATTAGCRDCGKDEDPTKQAGSGDVLGADGVRVVVQVRDFVAYSQLGHKPPEVTGDMVVLDLVDAPIPDLSLDFDVLHRGPAPTAEPLWRDVGARYEITLHRGFLTNAQLPPRPDQIFGPITLRAKPDLTAVPRDPSLEPATKCVQGTDSVTGAPLPVITGSAFAAVIIPAAEAQQAHAHCEKLLDAPFAADAFWTLDEAAVRALERRLPEYLRAHAAPPRPYAWQDPGAFVRQYVGYEVQGKRSVHVSLIPWWRSHGWRCRVIDLCPLESRFFALELDAASGQLTRFVADPP